TRAPPPPASVSHDFWTRMAVASAALNRALRRPQVFTPIIALMLGVAAWSLPTAISELKTRAPLSDAQYWYDEGTRAFRNASYFVAGKAFEKAGKSDGEIYLPHARVCQGFTKMDPRTNAGAE